ncbi:MAG: valine--tRNA ligase [Candidatus Levybacteria bacterium]|nr:valine--tRNA ligase [Candidatus Levybacteria bacterium]
MEKTYNHKNVEGKIYENWEKKGYFKPEINPDGKPYCIILPPPNANGALHFGHAMFTVEDILIRYHRMKGFQALWLPGADHAGIETQFVFEKKLKAEGKSRLDFDRETLYGMIYKYVEEHRGGIENQLKRLGFSLDWSREKYTLDSDIVKLVHKTFKRMYDEGLVYRDFRLVNYCTFDGTSFSDLELIHEEKERPLYYIKYGPLTLATTRPETKFGDTAVAVHPTDLRYKKYVGKEIEIETVLGKAKIKVIADESVDKNFGTGVVKITPSHDFNDFEVGKRHNLEMKQVIGFDGKMNDYAGKFKGLYVKEARRAVVEEMKKKGLIEKIDEKYITRLSLCYKCKNVLEPLPLEQWFIKVKPLAEQAIKAVRDGKIKITPSNFENIYFQWLENLRDWNISRQIVWGIRIPAWKSKKTGKWVITEGEEPKGQEWEQDTDTFDTWFSSGQWPFVTLMSNSSSKSDFEKFYPTSVMETGYDLLRAWVSRMVMLGLFITGDVPFKHVLFHGLVNDPYGKKMSKSKGNVVNPLELIDKYGADSVRFALVYGNATGNDQSLSYQKLEAARKFANKLWNMARFIEMKRKDVILNEVKDLDSSATPQNDILEIAQHKNDIVMIKKTKQLTSEITNHLDSYSFNYAAEKLYEFTWHEFADKYIEDVKNRIDEDSYLILTALYLILLKLLHPFMPFITEEIYQRFSPEKSIMIKSWPE